MTKKGFVMEGFKKTKAPFWTEIKNNCEVGKSPYLGGL
jgi:hypothetical protein